MKYQTLQKTALAAMAMLASLALSAQAGKPAPTRTAHIKHATSMSARGVELAAPAAPQDVLYDQYDNVSGTASFSGTFTDAGFDIYNSDLADDFVVPSGETWTIQSIDADGIYFNGFGPANSFNVIVYSDNGGKPGGIVASEMNLPASVSGSTFTVNFTPAVVVGGGKYWVEVQANLTFATEGEWGWTDRTVQSNSQAQWQNPGGGFGACTSWMDKLICIPTAGGPDQVYRLNGTKGNGTPTPTPTPTATPAGSLWYNGDFDGVNGLANEQDTSLGAGTSAHVYDDFNVTDESGWDVTSVYSNNLADTHITGATWEVRQGVSTGNGGTLVASGMTSTPTVTPTGRSGFGYTEYMVEVPGLNLHLNSGTYWLNVTPIGDLTGRSFDSTTSGANCIGTPCGNDGMAFFTSDFFGFFFTPTDDPALANGHDFSMGVNGTVSGGGGGDLTLVSAVSRKTQGGNDYDINLPLTGDMGIEGRDGGKDTIVLTFSNNITNAGTVTSSCGTAGATIDPNDAHNIIVTVGTSHCNAMTITITVSGATDDQGNSGSATVSYGKLLGDVNGDGIVNNKDAAEVRNNSPRHVDSTNFRDDVNVDGTVNNKDLFFVKANRGSSL